MNSIMNIILLFIVCGVSATIPTDDRINVNKKPDEDHSLPFTGAATNACMVHGTYAHTHHLHRIHNNSNILAL